MPFFADNKIFTFKTIQRLFANKIWIIFRNFPVKTVHRIS